MSFYSARRLSVLATVVAALALWALPSAASATTDLGLQCSGSSIKMLGSTFQAPADFIWTGFNYKTKVEKGGWNAALSTVKLACQGTEEAGKKTSGKPTVRDEQGSAEKGSGACLKDFGASGGTLKTKEYPICGTDEAPSISKKLEMEAHGKGQESESILSVPVLQGAIAIIVHLPKGCLASSEPKVKGVVKKIGRLSLDQASISKIYRGEIETWEELLTAQGTDAKNKITCSPEEAIKDRIVPVVRVDKSGTTHIFKEFLAEVDPSAFSAEEFFEINNGGTLEKPCGEPAKGEESKTWAQVAEGCENQRWPAKAKVLRNEEHTSGTPGEVAQVNKTESSIGYADLAPVREEKQFSEKATESGEEKAGEKQPKFWAYVENNPNRLSGEPEYQEPASKGDNPKLALSNCKSTVYAAREGEAFPPHSTRSDWSGVKAEKESKTYSICGLTYQLAYRAYAYYLEPQGLTETESKEVATTSANFLNFVVNSTAGGKEILNHDYEALPLTVRKIAEEGIKEIGNKKA